MPDFADNYSQATIHSSVIFYVDGSGKLAHKSNAYISNHKTIGIIIMYNFLKHFQEHYLSKEFPFLHKVFFFLN